RRIIRSMTRVQPHPHWSDVPSLSQALAHSQTFKADTAQRGSFSGKRRSRASREPRFERPWDRRDKAQSPSRYNKDSRDAGLRPLPRSDDLCSWAPLLSSSFFYFFRTEKN